MSKTSQPKLRMPFGAGPYVPSLGRALTSEEKAELIKNAAPGVAVRLDHLPEPELTGGIKADDGKVRLELIPPELPFAVGKVLTFGAQKYADRNWEKGMKWSRVFGAMLRHSFAWWGGKGPTSKSFLFGDLDPETKMSHLWHAACCVTFLIAYEERPHLHGFDDRPGVQPDEN